ncbi:MAG: hypothetical protein R3B06_16440 [Kofleriaceae bacterium]
MRPTSTLLLAAAVVGCAAQRAQGPLDVPLGLTVDATAQAVRRYDFCRAAPADGVGDRSRELFPQCGRPGVAFADAWVVAHYRGDRLVRLQRFERWAEADRAAARWNQLIERRSTRGGPSATARDRLFARQGLPAHVQSWVAFERDDALVGLYLLTPTSPTEPAILEELTPLTP